MDFLRVWFLGVAGAAMAGVFALAVTPQGTVKKVVRVAAALVLCIAVLRPLVGFDFSAPGMLPVMGAEGDTAWPAVGEILEPIIAGRTAAYIETKAQALGLAVSVSVQCRAGEFWPEPWSVTVRHERPEHAKGALSKLIAQDLAIPPERQTYVQKGA